MRKIRVLPPASARAVRALVLGTAFLVATAAPAQVPITTAPGPESDVRAVTFSQQGGFLWLTWMHASPSEGGDLHWARLHAPLVPDGEFQVTGDPLVTRAGSQAVPKVTRTGSVGCPSHSICATTVVAYIDWTGVGPSTLRVHRSGDAQEWDLPVPSAARIGKAEIIDDGGTGVIVGWLQGNAAGSASLPRAQRLAANGRPMWGETGVAVSSVARSTGDMEIATDGQGGAFFAWVERRDADLSVVAMHLGSDGSPAPGWPADGKVIRTTDGVQLPRILADGSGGVYIQWQSWEQTAGGSSLQPRMVRLAADGSLHAGWSAEGIRVAPRADSPVYVWQLAGDGVGGVLLAATRFTGLGESRAMVQRLNGDGTRPAGWPAEGLDGSDIPRGNQYQPLVAGSWGEAILAWEDTRNASTGPDVYATRFLVDGSRAPRWKGAAGLDVCVERAKQKPVALGVDSEDNVFFAWLDSRTSEEDLWGTVMPAPRGHVSGPAVELEGPAIVLTSDNPARDAVRGVFTLSAGGHARVEVHDVAGRRLAVLADGALAGGPHEFTWNARDHAGGLVPAGLYFVSVRSADGTFTRSVVLAR